MRRLPVIGLNTAIASSGLFSVTMRYYRESGDTRLLPEELKKEISKKLDPVAEEFTEHVALKHPLFDYLREQSLEGFTSRQFLVYRNNFLRRTQLTIPSIAQMLGASVTYGDFEAAILTFRNLSDEMGNGEVSMMHAKLLLESHNIHSVRVFDLDPVVRISDTEKSTVLVPEVEEYRKAKGDIFFRPYPYIAGNTWAHEFAADAMLDNFKEAFFTPYFGFYTEEEFERVIRFFTVHKDEFKKDGNVEQQHEEMARRSVESVCLEGLAHVQEVREGGLIFLNHQAKLWDGMLREIEKARNIGEIVKPKPRKTEETLKTSDIDNGSPSPIIRANDTQRTQGSNSITTP